MNPVLTEDLPVSPKGQNRKKKKEEEKTAGMQRERGEKTNKEECHLLFICILRNSGNPRPPECCT